MLPDKMVGFVHGPHLLFFGTRNAYLRPTASWAFGALADSGQGTIIIFVPEIEGAERPIFNKSVEIMRPKDTTISTRTKTEVMFR